MNNEHFWVEGRKFDKFDHAITFAQRLSEEMERPVDVKKTVLTEEREWVATMRHQDKFL